MEHDEACGYTEENPVCTFVYAICPVQQRIDDILVRWIQSCSYTKQTGVQAKALADLMNSKRYTKAYAG